MVSSHKWRAFSNGFVDGTTPRCYHNGMKKARRWLALATFAAFLGLTVLKTFHGHQNFQAESHCGFCELIHQTPALTNPLPPLNADFIVTRREALATPSRLPQFVFYSCGRSPPSL
jgi:hypothetical protein